MLLLDFFWNKITVLSNYNLILGRYFMNPPERQLGACHCVFATDKVFMNILV